MKALPLVALAAIIAAPYVARAADVPVSYTVDQTALKLAIAGTNVTCTRTVRAAVRSSHRDAVGGDRSPNVRE